MFGPACKSLVDSFILIYVSHPFDVGDKISLNGDTLYLVDKISLYTTATHTGDGRTVIFPNPALLNIQLYNYTRSLAYTFITNLHVDILTSEEQVHSLEEQTLAFLASKPNVWQLDTFNVRMDKIDNLKLCTLSIIATLNGISWAEYSKFKPHTSDLLFFLQKKCRELGISYEPPAQRVIMEQDRRRMKEEMGKEE